MKNKIIIITFIAYIAIISIGSILLKDREFSDMENRTLKTFPVEKTTVSWLPAPLWMTPKSSWPTKQLIL